MANSIAIASGATQWIHSVIASVPASIYFLSFLNYFSFTSIYVLLNFPIPEQVYRFLAFVYQQLNEIFLSSVGVEVTLHPLSDERVRSRRGVHFGVSSDIYSSQGFTILIVVANIILIFLVQWLVSFLGKRNPVRRSWVKEKSHMVSGHVINLIMPFTLPWTFMMLEGGIKNFGTKVNAACYFLIYFIGVYFPIVSFFEMLGKREAKLIRERNAREK